MANMIPSTIDPTIRSHTIRTVFDMFKNSPETKDWYVLHSFSVDKPSRSDHSIDFLVLAPKYGIFGLQMLHQGSNVVDTGHMDMDRLADTGDYPVRPMKHIKDKVTQMIERISHMEDQRNWFNYLVGFGLVHEGNNSESSDLVFTYSPDSGIDLSQFVIELSKHYQDINIENGSPKVTPDLKDVKSFLLAARPDYEITVPMSKTIEMENVHTIDLTEQQMICIDGLEDNERCLIHGLAGTGKTLLALSHAKSSIAKNMNVAFFCYNLLLADEIQAYFEKYPFTPAYTGSLTHYMETLVLKHKGIDKSNYTDLTFFYRKDLPLLALNVIEERGIEFDEIILDEAQDLFTKEYLNVIDALLRGGMRTGRWYFFGDFHIQTIFNQTLTFDLVKKTLRDYAPFATFLLTRNCRNASPIQEEMNRLIERSQHTMNRRSSITPEVKYLAFEKKSDQIKIASAIFTRLLDDGVEPSQITVLSPYRLSKTLLSGLAEWGLEKYSPTKKTITYSTIQGFKGLENDVIVLIDVYSYRLKELMYIGMSRAKFVLYVLESSQAREFRMTPD